MDEITLTLPRDPDFFRVVHLVVGGLAARLDLTLESLEDVQLALTELLRDVDSEGDVTVSVRVDGATFHAAVGPFERDALSAELERNADLVGLRRVLDTVCDDYRVAERDGQPWVELTKSVQAA